MGDTQEASPLIYIPLSSVACVGEGSVDLGGWGVVCLAGEGGGERCCVKLTACMHLPGQPTVVNLNAQIQYAQN